MASSSPRPVRTPSGPIPPGVALALMLAASGGCALSSEASGSGASHPGSVSPDFPISKGSTAAERAAMARFDTLCGTDWYGIYIDGRKVGYSTTATEFGRSADGIVLQRRSRLHMETTGPGGVLTTRSSSAEDYSLAEPFALLWRREERHQGESVTGSVLERGTDGYAVRTLDGTERGFLPGNYGLEDAFADALWVLQSPTPPDGSENHRRVLDTETLSMTWADATLVSVVRDAGGTATAFDLERHSRDGSVEHERLDAAGRVERWRIGAFALRRESADDARAGLVAVDLAALGTAKIDRPLGPVRGVRTMSVLAQGDGTAQLASFPQQTVDTIADGRVRVQVIAPPWRDLPVRVTEREQDYFSRPTQRFPADDPAWVALAAEAIQDATTDADRAAALCAFVAEYLTDDLVRADHATVDEVVAARCGDCSDHSLLYITLARAVGLPARPLTGFLYLGDESLAFGAHDWCEVAIAGRWVPVDPTWNEFPAGAARIRLGKNQEQGVVTARFQLILEDVTR